MRAVISVLLLATVTGFAAEPDPGELALPATKDVRVTGHPDEAEFNGGASPRLRTSNIKQNAAEVSLLDFDRAALAAFLEKNKDKTVSAKLVLVSRGLHHGSSAKVELAALDTDSDWIEGDKNAAKAAKGEPAFVAAQFETKPWTSADGKELANLRELFYDTATDTVKTPLNANALTVKETEEDKAVSLSLDAKFLTHLATDARCKGLILFNRDRTMLADFYSREQDGKGPKLVVTAGSP